MQLMDMTIDRDEFDIVLDWIGSIFEFKMALKAKNAKKIRKAFISVMQNCGNILNKYANGRSMEEYDMATELIEIISETEDDNLIYAAQNTDWYIDRTILEVINQIKQEL